MVVSSITYTISISPKNLTEVGLVEWQYNYCFNDWYIEITVNGHKWGQRTKLKPSKKLALQYMKNYLLTIKK